MIEDIKDPRKLIKLPLLSAYSFSDLISSFAIFLETEEVPITLNGRKLLKKISPSDSIVFVFVDGLGTHFLSRLKDGDFLNKNRIRDLSSVFPSTTSCAMFNCTTGLEPALHGIPGRWSFLRESNLQVNTFTLNERISGKSCLNEQISTETVWDIPSIYGRTEKDVFFVIPGIFTGSLFEKYLCGSRPVGTYDSISNAVDLTLDLFRNSGVPAFSFLYLMDLDTLLHNHGTESREVDVMLSILNSELERLAVSLPVGVRLCISADHGQITVPPENRTGLYDGDPLLEFLETFPYGEPRVPHFSVKKSREDDFTGSFLERFGEYFYLFSMQEASDSRLFGRNALSNRAKKMYGDYIGIAKEKHTFRYYPTGDSSQTDNLGEHGGSAPEETTIPLIIT
jgi:hypothetical protein